MMKHIGRRDYRDNRFFPRALQEDMEKGRKKWPMFDTPDNSGGGRVLLGGRSKPIVTNKVQNDLFFN